MHEFRASVVAEKIVQNINYKQEIEKLTKLQEIDFQLYNFNKERNEKPKILEALQKELDEKKQVLKIFEEKSKSLLLKRKEKEGELALKETKIKEQQTKLYILKTNKEYSAMLSEINGIKMDQSLIEEEIIKIFDEQDKLNQELESQKALLKVEEEKFNHEKQKILDQIKEAEAQIKDLESKRSVAQKDINNIILSQYERILKAKENLALVKAENNSCQGCFMNVPHQVINEIKMNNKLVFCQMCSRILYIPDE